METIIVNEQDDLTIDTKSIPQIVQLVLKEEGVTTKELSINFVTKEAITKLHADYFDDPTPTDCITFPIDQEELLGDIFVCPRTAIEYVEEEGGEVYEEVTLYIVHGLLHLIGYDDIEEADRVEMRSAEERHMKRLRSCGAIATA